MSGARDRHIDPVVLLNVDSWCSTHHGNKDDVKLTTLRAINRDDLILSISLTETVGYGAFLGVVGRDHGDAAASESLLRHCRPDLRVQFFSLSELTYA